MTVDGGTDVEIWWSSLVAADRSLLALLDATERARVDALRRPADQGRSLVAAALLRVVVGAHLGVAPGQVVIDRACDDCGRPHGRPVVVGPGVRVPQVSVSHSGLLVVVALTRDTPVGVDVQRVDGQRVDGTPGPTGTSPEAAAESWARREAVLKVGSGRPVAVCDIRAPRPGYAAALATLTGAPPTDAQVHVRHWP
ncbi:4'-phosphopantetheinyl transferase family protein [Cellulomonas aerilata]|uniref:4'-phosphopantetheinyl transferase domain-containing protein n=1 Tax=Cellulomonas aerilata TaxID=515326 RepID=A0A512DBJ4_9CELL|nr:hypothetical protein [Cellulomonas aerilata]GEO33852.1 hypothetical protein CAE01nite_15770 [Cellulomonas aerilata]